ncbi:MAG: FkbM family methyltransferase [Elusimicrobiota bacterium]|nr:FkbM family methyltransferase [Elusimicrobiota bacterium]
MTGIKDRRRRELAITVYGIDGKAVCLNSAVLKAALRMKRALPGRPDLCGRAVEKILGLVPVRLEIRLWNGEKLLFNAPSDLGNFLCDVDGIIIRDQYNAGSLAPHFGPGTGKSAGLAGKVVVDAGANIGLFSLYAAALGAKKVYAFEAVAETYKILKRNLALNGSPKVVKAVNIALGAESGSAEIMFNTLGEGSAMIDCGDPLVNRGITYTGRRRVKVAPLDGLVKGCVHFIKIDVEGYEKNVLLGAEGIIKKYKPVLSLAAYHRPADKKALPEAVRGLRADYKITLKTFAEDDFYCE